MKDSPPASNTNLSLLSRSKESRPGNIQVYAERRSRAGLFNAHVGQGLSLHVYCGSTGITVQGSI